MNIKQFAFISFLIFIIGVSISAAIGDEGSHLAHGVIVMIIVWAAIAAILVLGTLIEKILEALE